MYRYVDMRIKKGLRGEFLTFFSFPWPWRPNISHYWNIYICLYS